MADQEEASSREPKMAAGRISAGRRTIWAVACVMTNVAIGLISYVPLGLGYIVVRHYMGTPDFDLEMPGLGLAGIAFVLFLVVPVFVYVNLLFARRLPFAPFVTWAGAIVLALGPIAFGVSLPGAANSLWYALLS